MLHKVVLPEIFSKISGMAEKDMVPKTDIKDMEVRMAIKVDIKDMTAEYTDARSPTNEEMRRFRNRMDWRMIIVVVVAVLAIALLKAVKSA